MSSESTQHDPFVAFLAWFEVNKKRLLIAFIAVAVACFGYFVFELKRKERLEESSNALLSLSPALQAGPQAAGAKAADYLKVAEQYSNTGAGERAMLLAATTLFSEGKHAEAKEQFEQFLSRYAGSELAAQAQLGVAASLDAMNDIDKAVAAYQQVISSYPTEAAANQARLALASLFESRNQPEQALRLYEELARQTPPSAWSNEARQRQEDLLAKNPQLAATAAPATTVAPAPVPPAP